MDWLSAQLPASLKTSLAEASKQAQDLAEAGTKRAKELAQQASIHAQALAQQATVQAKVLADKAVEELGPQFTQVQARLEQLAASAQGQGSSGGGEASSSDAEQLRQSCITEQLLECVSSLTYTTFSDELGESGALNPKHPPEGQLTPWKERHAVLVLGRAQHLQGLRFALCPKRMTDSQFWSIYFALVRPWLPADLPTDLQPVPVQGASRSGSLGSSAVAANPQGSASSAQLLADGATRGTETAAGSERQTHRGDSRSLDDVSQAAADRQGVASSSEDSDTDIGDEDGGEGGASDLGDLEDDPELAAYLQEAMAGDDDDMGDVGIPGSSEFEDGDDEDLDDYITQLELGESTGPSPAKPVNSPGK